MGKTWLAEFKGEQSSGYEKRKKSHHAQELPLFSTSFAAFHLFNRISYYSAVIQYIKNIWHQKFSSLKHWPITCHWRFSAGDEISARGPYKFNIKWILRLHGKNFNPVWISAWVEIFIPVYVTRDEIFSPVNPDEISHVIANNFFIWLYFAFRLIFNILYATTESYTSQIVD
jgi:hypothetical protein